MPLSFSPHVTRLHLYCGPFKAGKNVKITVENNSAKSPGGLVFKAYRLLSKSFLSCLVLPVQTPKTFKSSNYFKEKPYISIFFGAEQLL